MNVWVHTCAPVCIYMCMCVSCMCACTHVFRGHLSVSAFGGSRGTWRIILNCSILLHCSGISKVPPSRIEIAHCYLSGILCVMWRSKLRSFSLLVISLVSDQIFLNWNLSLSIPSVLVLFRCFLFPPHALQWNAIPVMTLVQVGSCFCHCSTSLESSSVTLPGQLSPSVLFWAATGC